MGLQSKFRSATQIHQEYSTVSQTPDVTSQRKQHFEALRFGRRVIFDKNVSSKQLLETHLQSIKESNLN
jgi:hypothetical protein